MLTLTDMSFLFGIVVWAVSFNSIIAYNTKWFGVMGCAIGTGLMAIGFAFAA